MIIGGKDRGPTPLSLTLEAGAYEVELRAGDERHMVPVQVTRTRLQDSQKLWVSGVMKPSLPPVSSTRT